MLRYDIENVNWQRFNPARLNNPENSELILAVIELNTMQAIRNGYLQIQDETVSKKGKSTDSKPEQDGR